MYCVLFLSWTPTGFLDLSGKEDHVSCPAGRSEIVTLFPCGRKYWFQTIPRGLFPLVKARQYLIYRLSWDQGSHIISLNGRTDAQAYIAASCSCFSILLNTITHCLHPLNSDSTRIHFTIYYLHVQRHILKSSQFHFVIVI